jgi:UDP-glucuronate 4-epimerase
MTVLITGAAGFIGFHLAGRLLERGDRVIGVDDLNDYYDVSLKRARLERLSAKGGFAFSRLDIADRDAVTALVRANPGIDRVVHLAAQAGVRYSLENPHAYTRTNVEGHLVVLEACRRLDGFKHLVYASSSSVYGANTELPFSVADRVDRPLSLYGATKKSMEMMSHAYAHLYRLPQTGLRYFTVYGPWGRPDMAAFIFIRKMLAGEPIPVFNQGVMRRDFTYIDDIVSGTIGCLDNPPGDLGAGAPPPARIYNIGNHRSESLMDFIALIEKELGIKAKMDLMPMQPGDVKETFADIEDTRRDFGFEPKTAIGEGIPKLVAWYRDYYGA